jgi:hypothetical protein
VVVRDNAEDLDLDGSFFSRSDSHLSDGVVGGLLEDGKDPKTSVVSKGRYIAPDRGARGTGQKGEGNTRQNRSTGRR